MCRHEFVACVGFGIDAYSGVCHANWLENVAALTSEGAFLGATALLERMPEVRLYLEAVNAAEMTISHPRSLSFFHDVYTESLAEALLLSKNGGAVAVWASSGLTQPEPQVQMDKSVVSLLVNQHLSLGDAATKAKSTITDMDARRTYILFGDPLLRLHFQRTLKQIPFLRVS